MPMSEFLEILTFRPVTDYSRNRRNVGLVSNGQLISPALVRRSFADGVGLRRGVSMVNAGLVNQA